MEKWCTKAPPNNSSTIPKRAKSISAPTLISEMPSRDHITVERFYTDHAGSLELNLVAAAGGLKRIIREPTVNRPGLVLTGFTRYFAYKRVQAIGNAEAFYLKSLSPEERLRRYET